MCVVKNLDKVNMTVTFHIPTNTYDASFQKNNNETYMYMHVFKRLFVKKYKKKIILQSLSSNPFFIILIYIYASFFSTTSSSSSSTLLI